MRIVIRDLFHTGKVGIWVFDDHGKTVAAPTKMEFVHLGEGYQLPDPTFEINQAHLHSLIQSGSSELEMSSLGKALMPNRDKQLEALKYHLEDMRKLVFNKVDK